MSDCRCGRPTRDGATFCETCADDLARNLGEVPWLVEQLTISATRAKGVDYRRNIGGKGPSKPAERPLPVNLGASDAERALKDLLVSWARLCWEEGVRHRESVDALPADNAEAISRWLICRVDGLMWHPAGGDAVDEISAAVKRCHRIVDRPPDKWFAGPCEECRADMYAVAGAETVACESCGTGYNLAERRQWLLEEARHHHATATEIARAVIVWGGAEQGEERIVDRIRKWGVRKRIETRGHVTIRGSERALYRVGDVLDLVERDAMDAQEKRRGAA